MHPVASRLRRQIVLGLVVCIAGLAILDARQAPQTPELPKGTGLLMGQVVEATSKQPISGVIVNLVGGAGNQVVLPSGEIVMTFPAPATAGSVPAAPRQILTDESGRFLFRDVAKGTYSIRTTAAGYVPGAYGQNRPSGLGQSIVLERDDEKRGGVVVRLWKLAVITGRITDDAGEPAAEVPVRLVRKTFTGGRMRLTAGLAVSTDDRGIYRFASVTPGDYLVGVFSTSTTVPVSTQDAYMQAVSSGGSQEISQESQMSGAPFPSSAGFRVGDLIFRSDTQGGRGGLGLLPPPLESGRILAYSTHFYPNASGPAQATVLTLASGDERAGIDFQLKLQKTLNVSGTVTGPDGPMSGIGLRLLPLGAEEYASLSGVEAAVTATDGSGAFTFLGVSPGAYTLQCIRVPRVQPARTATQTSIEITGPNGMMVGMSMSGGLVTQAAALPTDPTLWGGLSVTVSETDVQGLVVALRPGARLSGRLVFEGGEAPPADVIQRASIQIAAMAGATPTQVGTAQKRIETDGSFKTVGYPPGRYSLSASIPPSGRAGGPSWRFRTAEVGGRDLSDRGLEIEGDDISGLTLIFTDRSTELTGTVVDAKGQPDGTALVVVAPADSQAWKEGIISTRRVRGVRTTSIGAFTIADLPPGQYFIAAVSDATVDNWQDPKKLEAISRVARLITVAEGSKLSERLTTVSVK